MLRPFLSCIWILPSSAANLHSAQHHLWISWITKSLLTDFIPSWQDHCLHWQQKYNPIRGSRLLPSEPSGWEALLPSSPVLASFSNLSALQLQEFFRWAWWSKPAAPMFRISRKEDHESEARLDCIVSTKLARAAYQKQIKQEQKTYKQPPLPNLSPSFAYPVPSHMPHLLLGSL